MSTLQEILTDIDERYPNSFSQAQKIRWLNTVQKEVFREMAEEEILKFTTIKDKAIYQETANIEFELIKAVTVDKKPYEYKDINDDAVGRCYYEVLDNYIGFYPVPYQDGMTVYVYHQKRPAELTASNLSAIPDLREDFQEILKYGVFRIVGQSNGDISLVNNYTNEYNAMLQKIKQSRYEKTQKYPTIRDVMTRRNASTRKIVEVMETEEVRP